MQGFLLFFLARFFVYGFVKFFVLFGCGFALILRFFVILFAVFRWLIIFFLLKMRSAFGSDKTVTAKSNKVASARLCECGAHLCGIIGLVELKQGALLALFLVSGGDVDLFTCQGIDARVVHNR